MPVLSPSFTLKLLEPIFYFRCYTVHVVELLNYYTNYLHIYKIYKIYTLKH